MYIKRILINTFFQLNIESKGLLDCTLEELPDEGLTPVDELPLKGLNGLLLLFCELLDCTLFAYD
jgi:hypothetical protein